MMVKLPLVVRASASPPLAADHDSQLRLLMGVNVTPAAECFHVTPFVPQLVLLRQAVMRFLRQPPMAAVTEGMGVKVKAVPLLPGIRHAGALLGPPFPGIAHSFSPLPTMGNGPVTVVLFDGQQPSGIGAMAPPDRSALGSETPILFPARQEGAQGSRQPIRPERQQAATAVPAGSGTCSTRNYEYESVPRC